MKYQLQFTSKAIKDLEKLSSQDRSRIVAKIEIMKDNLQRCQALNKFYP